MSTKQNWACALCGETFRRRSSGTRPNLNLHSEVSIIVRFTDFVIGVLDGRYKSPEPLATPIRRKSLRNFLDNKAINQHNKMSYFNGIDMKLTTTTIHTLNLLVSHIHKTNHHPEISFSIMLL